MRSAAPGALVFSAAPFGSGRGGSPLVQWPWFAPWRLAVPVPASWCFPLRRALRACRLPLGRRLASVGLGLGLGHPPRSRPVSVCRWSCFPVGSRLCPRGVLGFLPVLAFGRSVFGWFVRFFLFLSQRERGGLFSRISNNKLPYLPKIISIFLFFLIEFMTDNDKITFRIWTKRI